MNEYMLLDRAERQKHLKLNESCIEIGGNSIQFRGLLAHHLKTTIPQNKIALCCHACGNGKCSNPNHLYWGTFSDNIQDDFNQGKRKSLHALTKEKLGEQFEEWQRSRSSKGGKNSSTRLSDERVAEIRKLFAEQDQSKWGWLGKFANVLGVSHTQTRRLINKYCR